MLSVSRDTTRHSRSSSSAHAPPATPHLFQQLCTKSKGAAPRWKQSGRAGVVYRHHKSPQKFGPHLCVRARKRSASHERAKGREVGYAHTHTHTQRVRARRERVIIKGPPGRKENAARTRTHSNDAKLGETERESVSRRPPQVRSEAIRGKGSRRGNSLRVLQGFC